MKKNAHAIQVENLPVIGSIATMPTRTRTFSRIFHSILPQVDKLFVFLDGFEEIPQELREQPKCHVTLLPQQESLHASSRFLAPHLFDSAPIARLRVYRG